MRRLTPWLALIAILWLATGLRFYRLDAQSFWNDEGNSTSLSGRSLELIVEGTAHDIHPPLYYLLLHGWRAPLGDSEFSVRALSAFAGVLTVAATYALGRRLLASGALAPLLAALVAAVHPALIYYSQEARMYALLGLLAVVATLALWCAQPWLAGTGRARRFAVAYFLAVVAGLYTHYFFAAVLTVHAALILFWFFLPAGRSLRLLLRWAGLLGLAFLAYLPWLPIFLQQTGGRTGDSTAALPFLVDAARWLGFGATISAADATWPLLALALLLLLGLSPAGPRGARHPAASRHALPVILLSLLIPVLFMLAAGTTRPAYHKFMIVAVPFLALLAGRGAALGGRHVPRASGWALVPALLLLLPVLAGSGQALRNLYFDPAYARPDYRAMAAQIAREDYANAGIILNAPNQWEVFTYYHREGAPLYPLPQGDPPREQLVADLETIAARHDRLYALFWGDAERDPERIVERWLDQHAYKATEQWVGGVRFVTYAVPQAPAQEPETRTALSFGEQITLAGYAVRGEQSRPGDIVQVTLFWEATQPLGERYKVFLHLVDESGRPLAQRDSEPGGGLALTTTWRPGERVVDNHGLLIPPGTAPGSYTLRVGLYELDDPAARLPLHLNGEAADSLPLATITVVRED